MLTCIIFLFFYFFPPNSLPPSPPLVLILSITPWNRTCRRCSFSWTVDCLRHIEFLTISNIYPSPVLRLKGVTTIIFQFLIPVSQCAYVFLSVFPHFSFTLFSLSRSPLYFIFCPPFIHHFLGFALHAFSTRLPLPPPVLPTSYLVVCKCLAKEAMQWLLFCRLPYVDYCPPPLPPLPPSPSVVHRFFKSLTSILSRVGTNGISIDTTLNGIQLTVF